MNIIRVFLGVCVLNKKYELGLEEVIYTYSLKRHNLGRYNLIVEDKSIQLVTNLPTSSKNKPQGNVLLFDAEGYARDPMLIEFRVNSDPDVGLAHGSKSHFVHALIVWFHLF